MKKRKIAFTENLKKLLKQSHLRQTHVAYKLGINRSSFHNYLNGVQPRSLEAIVKICDFFEVSLEDLIFEKIDENSLPQKQNRHSCRFEVVIREID